MLSESRASNKEISEGKFLLKPEYPDAQLSASTSSAWYDKQMTMNNNSTCCTHCFAAIISRTNYTKQTTRIMQYFSMFAVPFE